MMNPHTLPVTLMLTAAEADQIVSALAKLPIEQAVDLWAKIRTQAQAQIDAATKAAMAPPEPSAAEATA